MEVRLHVRVNGEVTLELWQPVRQPHAPGQTFTVTAGCDKHASTCRAKFSNIANFRGFPHMPGNDYLTRRVAAWVEGALGLTRRVICNHLELRGGSGCAVKPCRDRGAALGWGHPTIIRPAPAEPVAIASG